LGYCQNLKWENAPMNPDKRGAGVSETSVTGFNADFVQHNKKSSDVTELEQTALGVDRDH
jgi:hypothetical protein